MQYYFTVLACAVASVSFSQSRITGQITDRRGEPIPRAGIFIADSYDGATSDVNGNFEFISTETGRRVLMVKFMGFKPHVQSIVLDNQDQSFRIVLEEQVNELNAVTISAGAFTASDESRRTVFRAVDIATTAGATADIAGALNTLPGTQKVGESGRLFVRGGDGSETRTFIDGLLVLDAYGSAAPNTPSRGRFLPFMFKGTSFSTGGYSAEFGQALSSALVLDSKDNAEMSRTDIGILSVGGDIAHTHVWNKGSVAGKLQYTDIRPYFGLINQEVDWKSPPSSLEGSAAFRQKLGKAGMFKFFGNFNNAAFSLYNHDIDNDANKQLYDLTNNYRYANGMYRIALSDRWLLRGGASYTSTRNVIGLGTDNINENEEGLHAKVVTEGSLTQQIEIRSGLEVLTRSFERTHNSNFKTSFFEFISAVFSETDIYATNNFVTRAGVRVEYNQLQKKMTVDPRLSLAYRAGADGQVSLAYGTFRQSAKNEFLLANPDLDSERATHYILNYQRINNKKTFRIETFYKLYDDLVKYASPDLSGINNSGNGFARGMEIFWRDNESVKGLDYWISYSLLDTERRYLDFPASQTPSFASAHNFSGVFKYFVSDVRSQLGMTYSFASGRPYHDPNSGSFNSKRTPAYHDVSFNWSYLPKPFLIVYFSCTNLLGRDNIFGYEFSDVPNEAGFYNSRPVRQAAKRFLFIGIFITISKEKSVNQLPSL